MTSKAAIEAFLRMLSRGIANEPRTFMGANMRPEGEVIIDAALAPEREAAKRLRDYFDDEHRRWTDTGHVKIGCTGCELIAHYDAVRGEE